MTSKFCPPCFFDVRTERAMQPEYLTIAAILRILNITPYVLSQKGRNDITDISERAK